MTTNQNQTDWPSVVASADQREVQLTVKIIQCRENEKSKKAPQWILQVVWPWHKIYGLTEASLQYVDKAKAGARLAPGKFLYAPDVNYQQLPTGQELYDKTDSLPSFAVSIRRGNLKKDATDLTSPDSYYWFINQWHDPEPQTETLVNQAQNLGAIIIEGQTTLNTQQSQFVTPANTVIEPVITETITTEAMDTITPEQEDKLTKLFEDKYQVGQSVGNAFNGVSTMLTPVAESLYREVHDAVIDANDQLETPLGKEELITAVGNLWIERARPVLSTIINTTMQDIVQQNINYLTSPEKYFKSNS